MLVSERAERAFNTNGAVRANGANGELRRNSRNLEERDTCMLGGRENDSPLVTRVIVDSGVILRPTYTACSSRNVFRSIRSDVGAPVP